MRVEKKKQKSQYVYVGIIRRAFARIIDAIILTIIFVIYYLFVKEKIVAFELGLKARTTTMTDIKQIAAILLGFLLIHIFYHVIIPKMLRGTLGKRIMGCIILNKNAESPGIFRLYIRYLSYEWVYTLTILITALAIAFPSFAASLPKIGAVSAKLESIEKGSALSYILGFAINFFPALFIPFNRRRMGLHDMIAGTRVVRG